MRREPNLVPSDTSVAEFRRRFPLGSTSRVVLVDEARHYAGIVSPVAAHAGGAPDEARVAELAEGQGEALTPEMDITAVMARFDNTRRDELAIVDVDGSVLGLLTEAHVRRRYGEELEKAHRDLIDEA